MAWDALLFDFEGTLADLSVGASRHARPYHDGRLGVPPARDRLGQPVLQACTAAVEAGLPVAVVSSSPIQPVVRWFEEQGAPVPEVAVAYHDTVLHRPGPAPLLEALTRLGVKPSPAVLSLGDSAEDTLSALAAGLTPATASERVPLSAPPALYLADVRALLDDDLWYALAGGAREGRAAISLEATAEAHELRVGGRLGDPGTAAMLEAGAGGRWSQASAELAHTLVIHALGARSAGSVLTWMPGFVGAADPLASLVKRLGDLCSVPAQRCFSMSASGEGMQLLPEVVELQDKTLLVLTALRTTGAGLEQAARLLRSAGVARVIGLVLAQEENVRPGPLAQWGPVRLANDDLRRQRSRPRAADARRTAGS